MEKKEFKKYFHAQLQTLFGKFDSNPLLSIEYSKSIATVKFANEIVGKIEFQFLTGKQLPIGALASVFIKATISGGEIWKEILENNQLKKRNSNYYTNYLYYFYSSSSKNQLFKHAKTNFFPSDNIEAKLSDFLNFISNELLDKIVHILMNKSVAIENILDTPHYYGQPELSILLLCRHNLKELPDIEQDKRFLYSSYLNKKIWEENKTILFQ